MSEIKYIENNFVFMKDGRVCAYYEMEDYNYTFLSDNKKQMISDDIEQIVGQERCAGIHFLQIATEEDLRRVQDKGKEEIGGSLKEFAQKLIDIQTDALVKHYGKYQVKYRHYIGFELSLSETDINLQKILEDIWIGFCNFAGTVRYCMMDDYVVMSNREIERYKSVERFVYESISRKFRFIRLKTKDMAYLIEHAYGLNGVAYKEYTYNFSKAIVDETTVVKKYDYIRLSNVLMSEKQRMIEIQREEGTIYNCYFTVSTIVNDLRFPGSEVLYHQQNGLSFPVDTSINVEIVDNQSAIKFLNNKENEMEDLIKHAVKNDVSVPDDVLNASEQAHGLQADLRRTKECLYKMSYLIRVWAEDKEELQRRCSELRDFYSRYEIKLVRPFGNMIHFHSEFLPGGKRAVNDYVQEVDGAFLSGLGFGAATKLGDEHGIYFGENLLSGRPVYIQPYLAAQGVEDAVTNSLAAASLGSTGWGKSVAVNMLLYYIAIRGGKIVLLDPKSERGGWKEAFPEIAEELVIVNLTSEEKYRGMLDPFVIFDNVEDSKRLAIDILTYLTGMSVSDEEKFPLLVRAVESVGEKGLGMLCVADELRSMRDEKADKIAVHIESFANYSFAKLLLSKDRVKERRITFEKAITILQVAGLTMPVRNTPVEEYTAIEKLSVAVMLAIGSFGVSFIESDSSLFKVLALDEAWALLSTTQGKSLQNKAIRAGRSMNSAIYFITQASGDIGGKDVKNNIGMKFAFHSDDEDEIEETLNFFGLDGKDKNLHKLIRGLKRGQCLYQDIRGNIGKVYVDLVFEEFINGFSTTPELQERKETI